MLLLESNYDPNRLHKSPIQHLLARLKGEAYSCIKKKKKKAREEGDDLFSLRRT